MTSQPHTDHHAQDRAGEHEVVEFTPRGLQALDALADVLVHRMATTPEGIARALDEVLYAPVDELCRGVGRRHGRDRRTHPHSRQGPPARR